MKYFPADWRADPALRVCSLAARGLWIEMLGIMHEADPRGFLLVAGRSITDVQLSALVGVLPRAVTSALRELEAAGVFSRNSDRVIFSRRMCRDVEKAAEDKANGKRGGNPNLKPGVNPPDKAHIPEARSQKLISSLRSDARECAAERGSIFDRFRVAYPKQTEAGDVRRELDVILDAGKATAEQIVAGAERYAKTVVGKADQYIKSPVKWLQGECWTDGERPAAVELPVIERDSAEGRAWDAWSMRTKGRPMLWTNDRATVRTRFPPEPALAS